MSASAAHALYLKLYARMSRGLRRPLFAVYLTITLAAAGLTLGHYLSERTGLVQLAAGASERLELYAATLDTELARQSYLPSLIAIDDAIAALLTHPDDANLRRLASQRLARISVRAGARLTVVTDPQGQLLASSHGAVGPDGAKVVPPYLLDRLNGEEGHFFAADGNTGSTDFFLVHPVKRANAVSGYIVVKLNLAPLEASWVDLGLRAQSERLLVVDDNDVVVLSSVPDWKFHVLGQIDEPRRQVLRATGRYGDGPLQPLGIATEVVHQAYAPIVQVPPVKSDMPGAARGTSLMAQEQPIPPLGVRLVTLSDPSEVRRQARVAAWGGAAFGFSMGLLVLYLASRRRALHQVSQAKAELQRAHTQLEQLVDERTQALRDANTELKRQIEHRLLAEDELLQAGKLAVLGQMSAGISHEINQPLTALRALSRNTLLLLENGRYATVAENLRAVDDVVERMSVITRQLKNFARKAEKTVAAVSLRQAVDNVLLLLDHRLRDEQVQVSLDVPEHLLVVCDGNRLEQVLINLIGNAVDAMHDLASKQLTLSAEPTGKNRRALVRVCDSGRGMDPDQLQRLFEPFFTTKPAGQGLGLGLVISSKIIHEFGGTLHARPGEQGMCFEFDLELAKKDAHV
ncbi:MAG: sensor histidine kinase [Burkholderiaceae bacterium]|nr:sensor histidine kinase [Burkholderiaceae bacterium]